VLKTRVVTAVTLLALLALSWWVGPAALATLLAALLGAAAYEWLRLAQWTLLPAAAAAVVFAAALLAEHLLAVPLPRAAAVGLFCAASLAWLAIGIVIVRASQRGGRVDHRLSAMACLLLLVAAWFALMQLVGDGLEYLLSALAIVWLADIAAYFAGRAFGKRKLAPAVSPGKTWAGVGGAVVSVVLLAALLWLVIPQADLLSNRVAERTHIAVAMLALVLLVAVSIVGDLFESLLKRQVQAKDSGTLLPGHGGVLDRIDALIAVLPLAALIDLWVRS
jgi:phosphatidate cytidylyltransferase